jgi:hypothetical protein
LKTNLGFVELNGHIPCFAERLRDLHFAVHHRVLDLPKYRVWIRKTRESGLRTRLGDVGCGGRILSRLSERHGSVVYRARGRGRMMGRGMERERGSERRTQVFTDKQAQPLFLLFLFPFLFPWVLDSLGETRSFSPETIDILIVDASGRRRAGRSFAAEFKENDSPRVYGVLHAREAWRL